MSDQHMPKAGRKDPKWTKLRSDIIDLECKESKAVIGKPKHTMPNAEGIDPNCKCDLGERIASKCTRFKAGIGKSRYDIPEASDVNLGCADDCRTIVESRWIESITKGDELSLVMPYADKMLSSCTKP